MRPGPRPQPLCAYCHRAFVPTVAFPSLCSAACRKRSASRDQKHRRRARDRGAGVVERVALVDVFVRDRWICQICGEPVERTLDDTAAGPTADHVVELSQGGNHTLDNLQLAHKSCNGEKARRKQVEENDAATTSDPWCERSWTFEWDQPVAEVATPWPVTPTPRGAR